jgi:hypothetical protein
LLKQTDVSEVRMNCPDVRLHGAVYQKAVIFMVAAART